MVIKLERMDWENIKESSIAMIRTAMVNLETGQAALELAEKRIKECPPVKITKS